MGQTLRDISNAGRMTPELHTVFTRIGLGDILRPVSKPVTQSSSAIADFINLSSIVSVASPLPPMAFGGVAQVRAGGTSATGLWTARGYLSVEVPDAGLTIAGADADGNLTVTKAPGVQRLFVGMYVGAVNTAAIYSRKIRVLDPAGPVPEILIRLATSDGSALDAGETATALAAALNADADAKTISVWTAGGTGASLVAPQVAASRGVLPAVATLTAAVTRNHKQMIFPTTVTDAILYYQGAPTENMEFSQYLGTTR